MTLIESKQTPQIFRSTELSRNTYVFDLEISEIDNRRIRVSKIISGDYLDEKNSKTHANL